MTATSIAGGKLDARLETKLPAPLEVGAGTALFLEGRCSHPEREVRRLEVAVGPTRTPVSAHNMPRPGTVEPGDWWWAFVPIEPVAERRRDEVLLCAHLAGGGSEEKLLGRLSLVPGRDSIPVSARPRGDGAGPLVAVCMATYNPPRDLFSRQIESIRSQTHDRWICLISDDCSDPEAYAGIEEVIGDDERFAVSRAPARGGFYRNFGRALSMCPREATHIALSDQDDRWYPDKLERLLGALAPDSHLVYSDARIVDEEGRTLSDTYWQARRNNYTNFTSLLLANTITGAASLYSADLLRYALPFPPPQGNIYHDHWLATVAMALGPIGYVDDPLYEYVQHETAVVGHAKANSGVGRPDRRPAHAPRNWRSLYFGANCRIALFSRVLEMRCGELMPPPKRRIVRRLGGIAESPGLLPWLTLRSSRWRFGWNETAGREKALAKGLAWRVLTPMRFRARATRDKLGLVRRPAGGAEPLKGQAAAAWTLSKDGDWLTPLLVDFFARDGSTLMMRLLSTSPEIVVEEQYPFERKYFAYLWRWARLLDRSEWPREEWKLSDLGSLHTEVDSIMLGPPPWLPRELYNEAESGPFSMACFEAAWSEFSTRAIRASKREPATPPRFYAEKHLNTWMIDFDALPDAKLIVLLRDPRDTFVSIKSFSEQRGADFGQSRASTADEYLEQIMYRQKERLQWIERLMDEGKVPIVRYEELVNDLAGAAKRLEDAFSVKLDPQAALTDRDLHKRHATTRSPASSVGRWRTELTDEELAVIEGTLGAEMESLGFTS